MNGNGWVGSTAIGVSSGNTSSKNSSSSQRRSSSVSRRRIDDVDAFVDQLPVEFRPAALLVVREPGDFGLDRLQLFGRRPALLRGFIDRLHDLLVQTGDADGIEFVKVRRRDGQETGALEQRMARILRLLEHPAVELQPRQLTVVEAIRPLLGRQRHRAVAAAAAAAPAARPRRGARSTSVAHRFSCGMALSARRRPDAAQSPTIANGVNYCKSMTAACRQRGSWSWPE